MVSALTVNFRTFAPVGPPRAPDLPGDEARRQQRALAQRFADIRRDIETASTPWELGTVHTRAQYLRRLTRARSWEAQCGDAVHALRRAAQEEFVPTVQVINRRADALGLPAAYDTQ